MVRHYAIKISVDKKLSKKYAQKQHFEYMLILNTDTCFV